MEGLKLNPVFGVYFNVMDWRKGK